MGSASLALQPAGVAALDRTQEFTKGQRGAITNLGTFTTETITPNLADGNLFEMTLNGAASLGNPSNVNAGHPFQIIVRNGTGGDLTLSGTFYDLAGQTFTLSGDGSYDILTFLPTAADKIAVSWIQGFTT